MNWSKVIITKPKVLFREYSFENETGLSTFDLALISINKITREKKLANKESSEITYLI